MLVFRVHSSCSETIRGVYARTAGNPSVTAAVGVVTWMEEWSGYKHFKCRL